jgi:ethanolamine kinase
MRAYGNNTEILIDRDREAQSHGLLAKRGLAPPLLARFNNGLLYRFIQGRVCTPQDLTSEPVWRGVAKRLGQWHGSLPIDSAPDSQPHANGTNGVNGTNGTSGTTCNGDISHDADSPHSQASKLITSRSPTPNIWIVMQRWVLALPVSTEVEKKRKVQLQKELERSFLELDDRHGLGHDGLVFGHCDLLSANVIILPSSSPASQTPSAETVSFIDYEYAIPCPAAFDIANHFAEWGGYDCDYNMLPTKSIRRKFLKEYLLSFASHTGQTVNAALVNKLAEDVDRYRGMPGLYWGIWSLIQATISQIDFDYASYAEVRLGEYWAWREETEGTRKRAGKEIPLRERRWAQEV